MDPITLAAASGMRARLEALDVLANNIANATTLGYKADRELYGEYVGEPAAASGVDDRSITRAPVVEKNWTDFSQASITPTSNPLDLALSGSGFFVVRGPDGLLFTRNGALHLSSSGDLQTADGLSLQGANGKTIRFDSSDPIEISPDGTIRQSGQPRARLSVVDLSPDAITKRGAGYFQLNDPRQTPAPATGTTVLQGRLEQSNAGSAENAVRLVSVLRQFEMLQRALVLGGEMNRRAVEEVAKVGS